MPDEDRHELAKRTLENGAMQGSIYALIELGSFYQLRDPVLSQAYFRAATARGDWMLALRPKPRLDTLQDGLATLMALELLENLDRQRAARGLPPLVREMRPGLAEFVENIRIVEQESRHLNPEGT